MKNAKETIKINLLKKVFPDTYKEYLDLKKNSIEVETGLRAYTQTLEEMYAKSESQLADTNKTLGLVSLYIEKQLSEVTMKEYKYKHVYKCMDSSVELFKEISSEIYKINIQSLKRKDKIKIYFLAVTASTWSCDSLYKKLIEDDRFEVNIIITPFENGTPNTIQEIYNETRTFFNKKGYKNIGIYDENTDKYLTFEEVGSPDILFHLNPHTSCIPENFKIDNLPLNVLNVYIPYGIMTFGMTEIQYNQMSHHLFWKIFCESQLHKEMAKKCSVIGDINVEVSGYLKMDTFLDGSQPEYISNIWRVSEKVDSQVNRIIYAPHHTLGNEEHSFSTFSKNYREILEYAKNHPNTSWIYKPHPLLKQASVKNGLFKDEQEYECYVKEWENLSNARVVTEDSYIDIFKTSDAMILDSVSFLSEYLYVNKPILLLTRDTQTFNDYGQKLKKVLYKVDGSDIDGIFNFIEEVVINIADTMKKEREDFFENYLNYLKFNKGLLASDYIYNYLKDICKHI